MNPLLAIPLATGVVLLIQVLLFFLWGRKADRKFRQARDYPSADRKYPLIVDAKLDKDL